MSESSVARPTFKASLSKSQAREGWSIIFRHPVRTEEVTGKPGKRVRRGLGTREREIAEGLVEEMNQLLSEPSYWEVSARSVADQKFDSRIVDIFYYKMVPEEVDHSAIRDEYVPLPDSIGDDYRKVLLLGTTGAGKTTLVRQLIGTDPDNDRFPSTSTARTTIADTELVLADGEFRGVVTFHQRDEVRDAIEDCVSAAVLAANRQAPDREILRRLLNHVDQRYRFSYILGTGSDLIPGITDEEDEDEDGSESPPPEDDDGVSIDLSHTNEVLQVALESIREIASRIGNDLKTTLSAEGESDERVVDEIFEEDCDRLLRADDAFHETVDTILDEIEARFDHLSVGKLKLTRQGWPSSWSWSTSDRAAFLGAMRRFSSNYAPHYGTLLTPLVNGLRVSGPFTPAWWTGARPRLTLMDGEGLGHTPDSSSSVPTSVMRRIEDVDAVVLVDNAIQPMQAASMAAVRALVSSGNVSKLVVCFTHFDGVTGDNLPNTAAKKQHILASAEAMLTSLRDELGPPAERALRSRFERATFFVSGIQKELTANIASDRRTIAELLGLSDAIERVLDKVAPTESRPVYDRLNLVLAIRRATENFYTNWRARLGLDVRPGTPKEHWTRIKALSRRLATPGWTDEYDSLRPVADLAQQLRTRIYVLILNPVKWEGHEPDDEEKQATFDRFADRVSRALLELASRRLRSERLMDWQDAYNRHGRGSTFERAQVISEDIYARAAPIPDVAPSPDKNRFLNEVVAAVSTAAEECAVRLM
jgi:hypothetical protein